jgi:hypothetical protein
MGATANGNRCQAPGPRSMRGSSSCTQHCRPDQSPNLPIFTATALECMASLSHCTPFRMSNGSSNKSITTSRDLVLLVVHACTLCAILCMCIPHGINPCCSSARLVERWFEEYRSPTSDHMLHGLQSLARSQKFCFEARVNGLIQHSPRNIVRTMAAKFETAGKGFWLQGKCLES